MAELSVHRIKTICVEEKSFIDFKIIVVTATDNAGNETEFTMYTDDKTLTLEKNYDEADL